MQYNKIVNGTLTDLKTGKEVYKNQFILTQDNKKYVEEKRIISLIII